MSTTNPFLTTGLVDYSAATVDHARQAIEHVVTSHQTGIERIIVHQQRLPTWDDLVLAVDELDANLQGVFYSLAPLVFRGGEWEAVVHEAYTRVDVRFRQKLTNPSLFDLYERLANSAVGKNLDSRQRTTLRKALEAFRLAGVALDTAGRQRVEQLEQQIRELEDRFSANVARSVEQSSIHIIDHQRMEGVPARLLAEMAAHASAASMTGWLITCDEASCKAILEYASDRALREQVYRAYTTRGWSADSKHDNGPVLERLAQARQEKARELGFSSHVAFSLQSKSAGSEKQVRAFLDDLAMRISAPLQTWQEELRQAGRDAGIADVAPWDLAYLQAAAGGTRQDTEPATLADFFPLDNVLHALVSLAGQLFGLTLQRLDRPAAWDPEVMTFEVSQDHARIGYLYVDALQRTSKQSGSVFTSYIRTRRIDAEGLYHGAVAAVFTDVAPGRNGQPPLLDHLALRKLYHEFGHALQHLLVRTDNHLLSDLRRLGTDGVEVSGKLLERWVWDADYLAGASSHYQSGAQLSPEHMRHLLTALQGNGLQECASLLSTALFDLDLHSEPNDGRSIEQRVEYSFRQASRWPLAGFERPLHALEHLVGGYDAGYYAYLWSDIQAFDLFTRFQASGLLDARTGHELQTDLFAPAGSRSLAQSIEAFLGRPASAQPYLQWHGLSGSVSD
ncbi:Oligopeptidase A [Pseudomonas fluorescens]|uniref:M3 family metallopeptidase n=1 Tax=Pseudomonas fluorescens TaxID=294 RepID=UPI0012579639|nr:M3 family metallopeptidase [Pseudomonas fluorescens]CAG8868943.1 Oligopeptidase A [Pseudomonas fluorescens]